MSKTRLKKLPTFRSDDEAEHFVDNADLSQYDLSGGMTLAEFEARRKGGRPRLDNPKQLVHIRLDADLVDRLRGSGPGWQTRINETLRKAMGLD
ncbi:MAG: BrnA antitoxin family protein [Mesorhizobium sp.]